MLGYDLAGLLDRDPPGARRLAYAFADGPEWLTAGDYLYYADVRVARAGERYGMAFKLGYEFDEVLTGSPAPAG